MHVSDHLHVFGQKACYTLETYGCYRPPTGHNPMANQNHFTEHMHVTNQMLVTDKPHVTGHLHVTDHSQGVYYQVS
jgi:hypothetical protein